MQKNHSPLSNKIALVTGAGSGLGKQIAKQLAAEGATVVIVGRTLATLNALAEEVGSKITPIQTDISDPDQVRTAFDVIDKKFGRIDILINNAAIYTPFLLEDAKDEELQNIININLLGSIYCMREAVKRMKPAGCGDIINVTSDSARNPFPFLTVYAATKAGLENFSQGQRNELAQFGVRVMVLRTGAMKGEEVNASAESWGEQQVAQMYEVWNKTGHTFYAGSGMDYAVVASAALNALRLPREATNDLIEVRSSQ